MSPEKTVITKKKLTVKAPTPEAMAEEGDQVASGPVRMVSTAPSANYTVWAMIALIAVLLFLGLIGIQVAEIMYYQGPKSHGYSAWPIVAGGVANTGPGAAVAPVDTAVPMVDQPEADAAPAAEAAPAETAPAAE